LRLNPLFVPDLDGKLFIFRQLLEERFQSGQELHATLECKYGFIVLLVQSIQQW